MANPTPIQENLNQQIPNVIRPLDSEISSVVMSEVLDFVAKNDGNLDKSKTNIEIYLLKHSIIALLLERGLTREEALSYVNDIDKSIESYKNTIDSISGEQ